MKYSVFKEKSISEFYPAIKLERIFPRHIRARVSLFLNIFLAGFALVGASVFIYKFFLTEGLTLNILSVSFSLPQGVIIYLKGLSSWSDKIFGGFLVVLVLRLCLAMCESFFNHFYFKGLDSAEDEYGEKKKKVDTCFEVALSNYQIDPTRVTLSFFFSSWGIFILRRCGLSLEEIRELETYEKENLTAEKIEGELKGSIALSDLCRFIYDSDEALQQFLIEQNIQRGGLITAAEWVDSILHRQKENERWWSRRKLKLGSGMGKNWSYGETFILDRYGHDITDSMVYHSIGADSSKGREEIKMMENVFSGVKGGNIALIGRVGSLRLEILSGLAGRIEKGESVSFLQEKRIFLIEAASLVSAQDSKSVFENEFIAVLEQAKEAGNMILVINNFVSLVEGAKQIGSDAVSILRTYLNSAELNVVAVTDPDNFHRVIEPDDRLMTALETVFVETGKRDAILKMLEEEALNVETENNVFFTHPALRRIAVSAKRHFASGVAEDKALSLLNEIAPVSGRGAKMTITEENVSDLIESKTGIPVGTAEEEEREKLLELEKELHKYVIAQDAAISSVAEAMRRTRAGTRDSDRPIGTFLFLGPTGVGKTQTAKALSESFFGGKNDMMRLDMSEYTGEEAMARLIGSPSHSNPGTLVSMIRENQYGILLLDEFEKTTEEVQDLFLRILDEGVFSDHAGKEVNARDLILIATSNAGSDYIWKIFEKGGDVIESKNELIDKIIDKGLFKPELLNRFDEITVFHPLEKKHLRSIADLMLKDLNERLLERKGVEIEVTEELIDYVIDKGYKPKFGARPMERVIRKRVEQQIADKMLEGEVESGMSLRLSEEELI